MTTVTTWSLQSTQAQDLIPAKNPGGMQVEEMRHKQYPVNRFLYQWIGARWQWTDRLVWSDQQWRSYAEADDLRTWVGRVDGSPAGYFELQKHADDSVEIRYFGLAEGFIGRGLGGYLLSECIRQAWAWHPHRVWVTTCSLDHLSALGNYQARGLELYDTVTESV